MIHKEQAIKYIIYQMWKFYNVMIDGKNLFDQPVKNNKLTYENVT